MKNLIILALLLPLVCSAQFKGRKIDVDRFKANRIDFQLEPDYDLFKFRRDIIRTTEEVEETDSTTSTQEVDYFELGFDLGNFLFYDLNHNLSFRFDQMMNLSLEDNFTLIVESYPFRSSQKTYIKFDDGKLSSKQRKQGRYRENFNLDQTRNTVDSYYKNRYRFSILSNEEGLFKKHRKRKIEEIYYRGNNEYNTAAKERWGKKFFIEDESICLDWHLYITSNENHDKIEVRYKKKKRNRRPVYTIQLNESEIIIYDKNERGYYIRFSENEVQVFDHKRLIKQYKLTIRN